VWPIDLVDCDEVAGFGYVMPLLSDRFVTFVGLLNGTYDTSFRKMIDIARQLVDAFASLHASGLCYRDISFGNLRVDPETADIAILDNDNVGTDGGDAFVKGVLRFMAPEVVRNECLPSTVTDLYSLAVFLFYLFVRGHPLEGSRTDSTYNWSGERSETELATRHFGFDPLFVFHPTDHRNGPPPGDPMLAWWPVYPGFFQDLFVRAFTDGLNDDTLSGRVTEGTWRRTLNRLADSINVCGNCRASTFWDPEATSRGCWNCGRTPPPPPLLAVGGHQVVLAEGNPVTSHHLYNDRGHRTAVGMVESVDGHPEDLVLRNLTGSAWDVTPLGEETKSVQPNQRLRIRPMDIDFGTRKGTITVPGGPTP
jgi:DNA-binding helix-hairpin-helix protein with protein kinase domain